MFGMRTGVSSSPWAPKKGLGRFSATIHSVVGPNLASVSMTRGTDLVMYESFQIDVMVIIQTNA